MRKSLTLTVLRILVLLLFLFSLPCFAEEWLCVTEHSAGFKYEEKQKKWRSTRFTIDEDKFVIAKSESDEFELEIKYQESAVVAATCKEGIQTTGYLHCDGFSIFKFNKNNGRFIMTFDSGYWAVNPENEFMPSDNKSESPHMNIGHCNPITKND